MSRSEGELKAAADMISRQYVMLVRMVERYRTAGTLNDLVDMNAYGVAIMLKLRLLWGFLAAPRPRPNDVVCGDFMNDRGYRVQPGDYTSLEIDRRIVHATYHGLFDIHRWDEPQMLAELVDGFDRFLEDLQSRHPDRAAWFAGAHEGAAVRVKHSGSTAPPGKLVENRGGTTETQGA